MMKVATDHNIPQPRQRMDLFLIDGDTVEVKTRYVLNRSAWMDKQAGLLPWGTRLTWYKGEGMGTHQYFLRRDGWDLERVTFGGAG